MPKSKQLEYLTENTIGVECSPKGKVTGTSILLKAYGKVKAVI